MIVVISQRNLRTNCRESNINCLDAYSISFQSFYCSTGIFTDCEILSVLDHLRYSQNFNQNFYILEKQSENVTSTHKLEETRYDNKCK